MSPANPRDRNGGPPRRIDLRVRRQAGVERLYTVRFTVLDGRGLVMVESDILVHEADLRTNGIIADLDTDQVLSGQFVFVSSSGTENAKYRTWDRDRAVLEALPPGSNWTLVEPTPVTEDPFFILDTDNREVPFPWRDLVPSRAGGAEAGAADDLQEIGPSGIELIPTATGEAPSGAPPDEPKVAPPPAPPPPVSAARTREQNAYQVVYFLREQLLGERARRALLEEEIRSLKSEIRALRGPSSTP